MPSWKVRSKSSERAKPEMASACQAAWPISPNGVSNLDRLTDNSSQPPAWLQPACQLGAGAGALLLQRLDPPGEVRNRHQLQVLAGQFDQREAAWTADRFGF